ncbi:MAG: TetR/AcrR family transcriptional regulator [Desulfobacteraceae bacterium]|nr:MAG: TetR/AcrR family transcriptional regulator [Desulfobacteraceae bacterium]
MKPDSHDIHDGKMIQILEAIRTVLARKGMMSATISEIANEAGVSRGLLHYYFKDKDDMVAQAFQVGMETYQADVREIFETAESASELAKNLCRALREILIHDPDFFRLLFERWGMARRGPKMAGELTEYHRMFRDMIREGMEKLIKRGVIQPRTPLEGMVVLLTGIVDGLGMQLVLEPDIADNATIWKTTETVVRQMLEGNAG